MPNSTTGVALILAMVTLAGCGGSSSAPAPTARSTSTPRLPPTATITASSPIPGSIPTAALQTPTGFASSTPLPPSSGATSTPNPAVTPATGIVPTLGSTGSEPTPISAPKIDDALGGFSLALIQGDTTGAEEYLTAELQAATPATSLPAALGLQTTPRRYNYVLSQETPISVTATMTYHFSSGNVVDRMELVKSGDDWQIASIVYVSG